MMAARQKGGNTRSKYGVDNSVAGKAERTRIVNGKPHLFASKREAEYYDGLKLLERAGRVRDIEIQPSYPIAINGKHICKVILDFRYWEILGAKKDHVRRALDDVKGKDTPLSRIKRKLVEAAYPGTKVKVVR